MNKSLIFFTAILSVVLVSCQFSKGVKKDLNTGLSTSYNGFAIDDIYLSDEQGNKLTSNKVRLGSMVMIVATDVDHFSEKDGKVFPGCRITLTDKTKKELLHLPDAFTSMNNGIAASEAKVLRAQLSTGKPMLTGERYHLNVRFFDKNKKENEIVSDVDLVMVE